MISIITLTGNRPEAFKLCEKWVTRQTILQSRKLQWEWIVVDDCWPETRVNFALKTIRATPYWKEGDNTFNRNMRLALDFAKGNFIAFMEDDDWYHPSYLEIALTHLKGNVKRFGLNQNTYYNMAHQKWRNLHNRTYCPLAFTVFRKELIPMFLDCLDVPGYTADVVFWRKKLLKGQSIRMKDANCFGVGVKGMPGRGGIGAGHKNLETNLWKFDKGLEVARTLFGTDLKDYLPFLPLHK